MNYNYETPFLRYKTKDGLYRVINKNDISRIEETDGRVSIYYKGGMNNSVYEMANFKGTLANLKDFVEPFYI